MLPAHLESNFINPDYRGAQPAECLRSPAVQRMGAMGLSRRNGEAAKADATRSSRRGDILDEIDAAGESVGIVTLAPELEGGLDLIRHLVSARTPRVAWPFGRDTGAIPRCDCRRRPACDPSVQPDAAARPSRARARRRDPDE